MNKLQIKALVFDQYGTVVDMQNGLTDAVRDFLKEKRPGDIWVVF